jgi:hypothetical protein
MWSYPRKHTRNNLFLIYINIIKHLNLNWILFQYADDIALFRKTMLELTQQMNDNMNSMKLWLDNHNLTVNIGMTKNMIEYFIRWQSNWKINEYQYLGMYINGKNIHSTSRRKSIHSLESFVKFKMTFLTKWSAPYSSHCFIRIIRSHHMGL